MTKPTVTLPTPSSPGRTRVDETGTRPLPADAETTQLTTLSSLLLIVGLALFAVAPLLYPGYIQTHAGFVPLWNLADWRQNLTNLGWLPAVGPGFDPLRSTGLWPYYLAGLAPLNPPAAVKLLLGLGLLLGGPGLFLWLRRWLGQPGALVAAVVYTYLPYHLATAYVRGAWGEALFWGGLPWALLAATYLVSSPALRLAPLAALLWLLLGLSQLGLTLWALAFLMALLLVVHRREALLPGAAAAVGVIVAALFYLIRPPYGLAVATPVAFHDHLLYPFQLLSPFWDGGASRPGWQDGLSLQLGLAAVGLSLVSVALWQRGAAGQPEAVSRRDRRLIFFLAGALGFSGLTLGGAALFWSLPGLASTLTYPWQLLGFAGLCLAVLAGAGLWLEPQLARLPLLAAILLVTLLSVYPYLLPQFIQPDRLPVARPAAELGSAQLALLRHDFTVQTSGRTVGLSRGETTIPLTVHGPLQPGERLLLNVTWQPWRIFDQDLKVFVHLVDASDNVLAQFDGQPRAGAYPTSQWVPGELIDDAYPLLLPSELPPGPYRVFLGLYAEATMARLPVPGDPNGRVILPVE